MKKGDKLVIYHTGDEKTAVGLAQVKSVDLSDPKVPLVYITAGPAIKRPKTLAEIKQQALFQVSPLVRQSRLSVVPLDQAQYDWIVHN
jgi:predicted RNA-binding protein with PUA-like domain